jgi:polyferredoxin
LNLSSPRFSPDDYDQHGALRLPLWFWGVLILQARTWLLFVMAGASREQGSELLALFYPDTQRFWYGILLGLPAALAFLLGGRRLQWPRLWRAWRWVLICSLLAALGGSLFSLWLQDGNSPALELMLVLLDTLALAYLLLNARLKACFAPQDEPG